LSLRLRTSQDASSNTQRKKTVRDLEEKLTKTDKKAEDYESRYNLAVRTINQLKNGIQSIFTRIGATTASVDEMLGNQVMFVRGDVLLSECSVAVLWRLIPAPRTHLPA
jgi:chromosome segregation ATPase